MFPLRTTGEHRTRRNDPHAIHGDVRGAAPHCAGRHAVGRPRRADVGRRQRRRARVSDRADAADARGPREGDRALPRHDRQAVRREPHHPADAGAAALRRIHRRHHLLRHQDRRDRRQQPQAVPAQVQGERRQGDPQVHLACATASRPRRSASTPSAWTASNARVIRARTTSPISCCCRPPPTSSTIPDDRLGRPRRCARPGRIAWRSAARASTWARASWPPRKRRSTRR